MSLDSVLLGILRKPSSGYEVKQAFDSVFRHIWAAELSQIYRTLKRLEQQRCLKSRPQASEKGPEKRLYEITAKGRKRLRDWLSGAPAMGDERYAHVAQLYFLGELNDLKKTLAFLETLREKFARRCEALKAMEAEWRTADPAYPDRLESEAFHTQMTLQMGIQRAEALTRWAEQNLRRVKKRLSEAG